MTKKDFKGLVFIASIHNGRKTIYCGSVEYLRNEVFGYTLECGNSWNSKINLYPKSAKSMVTALNKSAEECRRYNDYYETSSYEEFIAAGGEFDQNERNGVAHTSF
jgi:hypothetical protein